MEAWPAAGADAGAAEAAETDEEPAGALWAAGGAWAGFGAALAGSGALEEASLGGSPDEAVAAPEHPVESAPKTPNAVKESAAAFTLRLPIFATLSEGVPSRIPKPPLTCELTRLRERDCLQACITPVLPFPWPLASCILPAAAQHRVHWA